MLHDGIKEKNFKKKQKNKTKHTQSISLTTGPFNILENLIFLTIQTPKKTSVQLFVTYLDLQKKI